MKRISNTRDLHSFEESYHFYNNTPAMRDNASGQEFLERFYEDRCPPFAHEPTKDNFAVIATGEKGEGLISLKNFEPGQIVFRFYGKLLSEQTLFTLQQSKGRYIEDPVVMGKVLHSCDPNMAVDMRTRIFRATKPILAGEFLTMDYETTEDNLFRQFHCGCGAASCRGFIGGRESANKQQ